MELLNGKAIEFSISVPFERFTELKALLEAKKRWQMLTPVWSYFLSKWSPKCWKHKYQFIFMRQKVKKQEKGVIQLDLFRPVDYEYEYKVIISNKRTTVKKILFFHNGRGYQENIFSELKSQAQLDYIPTKNKYANQLYMIASKWI